MKQARRGVFMYNRNDLFVGRSLDLYGEWCDSEIELLLRYLRPGDAALDVGAAIGTHAVPFAEAVGPRGAVLAFEPQRLSYQLLCGNAALNCLTNLHCRQQAVGASRGSVRIPQLAPVAANNFGALPAAGHASGDEVDLVTIDSFAPGSCRLIKIDVEGMEADVIRGARGTIARCRPVLFVENNTIEGAGATIAAILELGYRAWWHIAPYFNARNFFGNPQNVFAEFQPEANLLCLPQGSEPAAPGLIACTGADDNWRKASERLAAGQT